MRASDQGSLFSPHRGRAGTLEYVPARASDPQSSWDAAAKLKASGELSRQQARALALVTDWPQTAAELAAGDYRLEIMLRKRLPELREAGQVVNGAPRDGAQTWRRA
jgi:hypothetical protein